MRHNIYSGKMQVSGITLIGLLALGVFLGSRAEALLDVAQLFVAERSSFVDEKVSSVHPADRKFANGNYEMESTASASAMLAASADRKLLDSGYLTILQEQMRAGAEIDAPAEHPADRRLHNLGYIAAVSGQQSKNGDQEAVHPADRKFLSSALRPAGAGNISDPLTGVHPADRKFLNAGYVVGQAAGGDE